MAVAACYAESQGRGIANRIAEGNGDEDFLGIKRSWDETSCRLYCADMPQLQRMVEKLEIDNDCLKVFDNKRMGVVFQVLQQRAAIARDGKWEPIYVPPKILEGQTASCIVASLEESLPQLKSSIVQKLAKDVYRWIFLQLMGDHVSANRLAQSILAQRVPDVCINDVRCAMHQAHHVFLGLVRPWNITAPMYSLGTGVRSSANQAKLCGALIIQAKSTKVHYGRPPPAEGAAFREWLFDISLGRFQNLEMVEHEKERERIRQKI